MKNEEVNSCKGRCIPKLELFIGIIAHLCQNSNQMSFFSVYFITSYYLEKIF